MIAIFNDNDLAAAARHYERALELDPSNLDVIQGAASLLASLGRWDEVLVLLQYEVARDPVRAEAYGGLALVYLHTQRFDEAIAAYRTALRLNPGIGWVHYGIAMALIAKGEAARALQEIELEPVEAVALLGSVMAHYALGQTTESDEVLKELISKYGQEVAYQIASALAWRGDIDRAFKWLDKAVATRDPGLGGIAYDRLFANLYDDPRWMPFLESIGKSPEQLAAIKFEVTLPK